MTGLPMRNPRALARKTSQKYAAQLILVHAFHPFPKE
jgi:hypothetical protein